MSAECGCRIRPVYNEQTGIGRTEIVYCPKHQAVDALLEAAKEFIADDRILGINQAGSFAKLKEVVAQVERGKA